MDGALQTTVSARQRTITVQYARGVDERYALFRFDRGDVYWRLDEFRAAEDLGGAPHWIACHGRLTVAEVVGRMPDHVRTILDWTRDEIVLGTVIADDIFTAMTREDALTRLQIELDAAIGVDRQTV